MEAAEVSNVEDPDRARSGPTAGVRRRLTVPMWFGLVFTAILVVVCGFAVVGARLLSQTAAESDDLVDRIQPASADAYRFQKALIDQETGVRGFVLSKDPRWLEPYAQGQQEADSAARRLRTALAGDPGPLAALARVESTAEVWRKDHAQPLMERTRRGAVPTAGKSELQASKNSFDRLRDRFDELNQDLLEERTAARADMLRTRGSHNWLFVGMLVAFLAIAGSLAILLHAAVGRPLVSLRGASQKVADGDFDHGIEATGPADVRGVATAVEAMRVRIIAALDASRAREELLERRTTELDEQAVELRRSNAELEQFAYVASHDLQEPLRKVASFCQLLEKRYGDQLDARAKQYIDFAVDGAKRMQVLINDLLTYSRVGRVDDVREAVDLDPVVDGALANLGTAVKEARAFVERPEPLPAVMGDPMLLGMLWQNLLGNAVKFRAPDRRPVIRIAVERDATDEEPAWHCSVTDNGIGIPGEFSEKVFVIFQRLHGRDTYGGTGIGLALCKKIVEYHGGRIWIDTAHTGGTRIHFTLPAARDADHDRRPQPAASGTPDTAGIPASTTGDRA